jgi:hypothetical protein
LGEIVRSKIPSEISIPNGKINVAHEKVVIDALGFEKDRIKGKASISNLRVAVAHQ